MKHWVGSLGMLAICAAPLLAIAAGPPPAPPDDKSLDFALQLTKTDTVFEYANGAAVDTTLERIGVAWYERFTPRLELGLHGGRSFLTQTNYAPTAGLEPAGYYAGIGLRAVLLEASALRIFVHTIYTYEQVKHDASGQSVALSWDELQARLGAVSAPLGLLRLYGGATWGTIRGQERRTGTVNSTADFERRNRSGGFVGLDLNVDQDGYIGIEARSGIERGAEIYFKKRF